LRQLLKIKPGDVIPISVPDKVIASVDGTPLMECNFGQQGGNYAIKVDRFIHADQADGGLGEQDG
jgi:flagellar motor switch protein FliM